MMRALKVTSLSQGVYRITLVFLLAYGAFLRSGTQAVRDFWVDEVWRAGAVLHSGHFFDITVPVQLSTFVLGKIGIFLFGPSPLAFKIWSQAFSIFSLFVFVLIARHFFTRGVTLVGLFLTAFNVGLVEHAHESKPFSLEACLALCMILLFKRALEEQTYRSWLSVLGLYGVMTFTSTIWLFFFTVPLYSVWRLWRLKADFISIKNCAIGVAWGVLVLLILLHYSETLSRYRLYNFWKEYTFGSSEYFHGLFVRALPETLQKYVVSAVRLQDIHFAWSQALLFGVWIVGPVILWRKKDLTWLVLVTPLMVQVGLAAMGRYPILSRVSTFYYPVMIFSLCVCAQSLTHPFTRRVSGGVAWLGVPMLALCLVWFLCPAWKGDKLVSDKFSAFRGRHYHVQEFSAVADILRLEGKPGDILITNGHARSFLSFYYPRSTNRFVGLGMPNDVASSDARSKFLINLSNKYLDRTAWFVFAYRNEGCEELVTAIKAERRFARPHSFKSQGVCMISAKIVSAPQKQ